MPRTITKNRSIAEDRIQERAIRVEKTPWWIATKNFFADRRTRMVCGILLLTNPNILVFSLSHFPLFIKYYLLLKVSLKLYLFKKH